MLEISEKKFAFQKNMFKKSAKAKNHPNKYCN